MLRLRPLACALVAVALAASRAAAQEPAPAAPPAAPATPPALSPPAVQPGYAPPPAVQPGYAPRPGDAPPGDAPQPGYAPPGYYGPPGYGPPGYGPPGYGYAPPEPPPRPPPKPPALRWSLRFDPFELILRRMTFQAEIAVAGPFAIEVVPSWIWGGPLYEGGIDERGFSIAANAAFYLSGQAFRGLWLKAHFEYENFSASFANPGDSSLVGPPERLSSAILGALFGDSIVLPRTGGFVLSGGIGVGVATAGTATLVSGSNGVWAPATTTLYDGLDRVRLLGTLGLGVAF